MPLSLKDRVKELTMTTGTGTLTLVSAPSGFRRFSSALSNGDTTYYCIESGSQWEVGLGTYNDNTLARTTVLASSNSGSRIDMTATRSFVFITYPADKSVFRDASGRIIANTAGIYFADGSVQTTAGGGGGGGGSTNWGAIGGTLSNQTDLIDYLSITYAGIGHSHTFASLGSKPTTLSGYGITDAYPLTGNPSGFLTTIVDGSVTLAKQANVATGTVFYRKTAGTGSPEVQSLATLKTDLGLSGTNSGDQDLSSYLTSSTASSTYVSLSGSYTDPSWIVSIPHTKITGLGTLATQNGTFSGTSSGTNTGDQDLSAYLTSATAASTYQPIGSYASSSHNHSLDSLSNVTITSNTSGEILKWNGSAWVNNTLAEAGIQAAGSYAAATHTHIWSDIVSGLPTTLSGYGITDAYPLVGNPSGFLTSIADGSVTLAKMADVATATVFYRKTTGTGSPEVQTLATLKTDLGLSGTNSGDQDLSGYLTSSTASSTYVALGGSYTDPAWLVSIPHTKVTGLGTLATQNGTFSGTSSGTNTGDNAVNSLYSGLVSNATHTGDATGDTILTLATVNSNVGSFGSSTQVGTFTVNGKGLVTAAGNTTITPAIGSITGLGTSVATALGVAVGSAGAFVTNGGELGTPSGGNLSNCTGYPTTGLGLTSNPLSQFAATTSAQLAGVISDETGSGALVFGTSPTLTTPVLGVASVTSVNKVAITAPATSATLTIADGATLTASANANVSGTNTGDNAVNSLYSGLVSNATHTGDATGSTTLTLATVNSNIGSFGSATQVGSFTVNAKGLVTAASNITITPAIGSITGLGTSVATALGVAVGSAGAFVVNGGSLGTPSAGVATNLTGTASGLTAGNVITNANLTGDVTSVGNATTIANAAVSLSKMADVATGTVFYRKTALSGAPEVQSLATLKSDLGLIGTNTGDQDLSSYLTSSTAASTYMPLAGGAFSGAVTSSSTMRIAGASDNGADFEVGSSASGKGEIYVHGTGASGSAIRLYEGTTLGMMLASQGGTSSLQVRNTFLLFNESGNDILTHDGTELSLFGNEIHCHKTGGTAVLNLYTSDVSATDFERFSFKPTTSDVRIGLEVGSTGGTATRIYRFGQWDSSGTWVNRFVLASTNSQFWSDTTFTQYYYGHGDVSQGTIIRFYKARGTDRNSMLYPQSNDTIFGLYAYGYDESLADYSNARGSYIVTAANTWTSTSQGIHHTWQTVDSADATMANTSRMRLQSDGNLVIGGTAQTSGKLQLTGSNSGLTGVGVANNRLRFTDTDTSSALNQPIGEIEFYSADSSPTAARVVGSFMCSSEGTSPGAFFSWSLASSGAVAELMRLESSGFFGIGRSDPQTLLHVEKNTSGTINAVAIFSNGAADVGSGAAIYLSSNSDTVRACYIAAVNVETTGGNDHDMLLATNASGATPLERMRIGSTGNVGIGTGATISARTHVISTTEQLRIGYDTSNYYSTTVGSTGAVTFNAVGAGSSFTFSDAVTCSSSLSVTGQTTLTGSLILDDQHYIRTASLYFDTYGTHNGIRHRRANGTLGSSTQVLSGDLIGFWNALGWHSGGAFHSTAAAGIYMYASENFTSTAHGGNIRFLTTATTTTTLTTRFYIGAAGNIGIGAHSSEPTTILDIIGNSVRVRTARTPASAAAAGNQGEVCWDSSYIYVCTATNTWKRAAIATW